MNIDLLSYFAPAEVEQLARSCGFVERSSPITGVRFLLTFTIARLNTPEATLAQKAAFLSSLCATDVSAQAIDDRIRVPAMAFMRCCLEKALIMAARPRAFSGGALAGFDHVYIIDSTNFAIHPSLREIFKGSGGSGSVASLRIQLVMDYMTGRLYVECGDTKLCDAPTLQRLVETHALDVSGKCLFLSDLGYFKTATCKSMNVQGIHFTSKLAFKVALYDTCGKALDLKAILKENPESLDLTVILDGQTYRLVAQKLPEAVVNQRLRKANKTSKDNRGHAISDDYRRFLGYAIFLTNLGPTYGMNILFALYKIRWQIELVFKTWKSILTIHKTRTAKLERLMCEVYGKLIVAALSSMMTAAAETASDRLILSLHRAMKQLQSVAEQWALAILQGPQTLNTFIVEQIRILARLCKKHRQKNKPTLEARLQDISPTTQTQPIADSTLLIGLA